MSGSSITQHNITAMGAFHNYSMNNSKLSKTLLKLSSGYKINSAADDAAGLAISEKMRMQISGLQVAQRNAKDGISLVQTAEGALTEVHDMLNRMYSLAEQSANGTYSETERQKIQDEIDQLSTEIDRIADSTNFNGMKLLNGDMAITEGTPATQATFGGSISEHTIDATKTSQTIHLGAKGASGSTHTSWQEGDVVELNLGLTDDTSMSVKLKATYVKDEANSTSSSTKYQLNFVDEDGNTVIEGAKNSLASGTAATLAQVDPQTLSTGFVKALKNTALGESYKMDAAVDNTGAATGDITFTAKTAGADTVMIRSISEIVRDANGNITDAIKATATEDGAVISATTAGTDAQRVFLSDDLVLYNDQANNGEGNLDDAMFEINGHKFVIGIQNGAGTNNTSSTYNSTVANLAKEGITFISVVGTAVDKTNGPSSSAAIVLNDPDDAAGDGTGNTTVELDEHALAQIKSEISETLGVKVTYQQATTGGPNGGSAELENEEELIDSTSLTANALQGFFKVEDTPGTDTKGGGLVLQIGDTSEEFNRLTVNIQDTHSKSLFGLADGEKLDLVDSDNVTAQAKSRDVMDKIKGAIDTVSNIRGTMGAMQNRLEHTINNLSVTQTNLQDAESTIRDTDVAEAMMQFTKDSIMNQLAQAMLAQANQLPQGVLQLIS